MRVLHLIETADPRYGGPVEGAIQTAEAWKAMGCEQDLLTLDRPDASFFDRYPGKVHALGHDRTGTPWRRYGYTPGLAARIREIARGYDAVIVAGMWTYLVLAARRALTKRSIPLLVYPHGTLDPWFRKVKPIKHVVKQVFWLFSEGPLFNGADCILFTTEEERQLADKAFWPYHPRGRVVGYGTSDVPPEIDRQRQAFDAAFPQFKGEAFLLFLSRLHPKKGCDLLVEALGQLAGEGAIPHLVVAGQGDEEMAKLSRRAVELNLADRIHFIGMITDDVKWGALRRCDAFILMSHQENFGVAVAEAMACSKPVLISNKVNIWREIEADRAGIVGHDTVEGAKVAIRQYLAMSSEAKHAMGERSRASFLRRFTVEASARIVLGVIEELRASRRKAV